MIGAEIGRNEVRTIPKPTKLEHVLFQVNNFELSFLIGQPIKEFVHDKSKVTTDSFNMIRVVDGMALSRIIKQDDSFVKATFFL